MQRNSKIKMIPKLCYLESSSAGESGPSCLSSQSIYILQRDTI